MIAIIFVTSRKRLGITTNQRKDGILMKINANDLVKLFAQAWNEQWGYIWGTSGQVWTQSSQNRATRDMTVKYGQKWVGRKVADCSGLFVWAFRQLGADIYHGSNTIWNKYLTDVRGEVSADVALRPGTAVFLRREDGNRHHIGLYIGDGKCIEAKSTTAGVVMSDIGHWDEYGELKDVDYDNMQPERVDVERLTLRKGSRGVAVVELQQLLNAGWRDLEIEEDGVFGTDTLLAVKAFQEYAGLTADGVVGKLTWAALVAEAMEGDESDETVESGEEEKSPEDLQESWQDMSAEEKIEVLRVRVDLLAEAIEKSGIVSPIE